MNSRVRCGLRRSSPASPCCSIAVLADIARLRWSLNIAATVREETPVQEERLAAIPPERPHYVAFRLQPSQYLASPWPIDAIWQANTRGRRCRTIDIASGGGPTSLQNFRRGRRAGRMATRLDPGAFGSERTLADGLVLAAVDGRSDPEGIQPFEMTESLRAGFDEG